MDYQASKSSGKKIILHQLTVKTILQRIVFVLLVSFVFPSFVWADGDITENPLYANVTITAVVPNLYSSPPTQPAQPINWVDMGDNVLFKGVAYPGSIISLLKNGVVVAQVPASPNGNFEFHVRNLDAGVYSFGVRAEDADHLTSKLLQFTVFVTSGITTVIDGIFMPPTITSDKSEVKHGEIITFLGTAAPDANVKLSFHSDTEIFKKVAANSKGIWVFKLDSSELELGNHESKARSITESDISPYSDILPFIVGDTNRLRSKVKSLLGFRQKCDLNSDGRVNILDFSIMAFWYKRLGFPAKVDLNTDNKVNLTDLSILAYCWTG